MSEDKLTVKIVLKGNRYVKHEADEEKVTVLIERRKHVSWLVRCADCIASWIGVPDEEQLFEEGKRIIDRWAGDERRNHANDTAAKGTAGSSASILAAKSINLKQGEAIAALALKAKKVRYKYISRMIGAFFAVLASPFIITLLALILQWLLKGGATAT